jgi:hypothetical protein
MQMAAWSRKNSEHFASHASMSSTCAAELHMLRGHRVAPPRHVGEAAARLEKHGQSVALSVWQLRDNAPRWTLLIDGHVMRQGTSLVGFM